MIGHLETVITTDALLVAQFAPRPFEEWFYGPGVLGLGENPAVPPRPYIAYTELTGAAYQAVRKTSNAATRNFQFFVYDEMGDYTRINLVMRHLERIIKEMAPFDEVDADGIRYRCSESAWMGISGTANDPQYDSSVRYGTARFTVSS